MSFDAVKRTQNKVLVGEKFTRHPYEWWMIYIDREKSVELILRWNDITTLNNKK